MSQKLKILEHLKEHGSITTLEAIQYFGCTRLSGRIWELRAEGHNITSKMVTVHTRSGKTQVARYCLEEGVS